MFRLVLVALILLLAALPVFAQEVLSPEAGAIFPIPAVFVGLIALNNRGTEFVKLWLTAENLPIRLKPDQEKVVIIFSSLSLGLGLAYLSPQAQAVWGPDTPQFLAIALTAGSISLGGAYAQKIYAAFSAISDLKKPVVARDQ